MLLNIENESEKTEFIKKFKEPQFMNDIDVPKDCDLDGEYCLAIIFRPDILHFGQKNDTSHEFKHRDVIFSTIKRSRTNSREYANFLRPTYRETDYQFYPKALHSFIDKGNGKKGIKLWFEDRNH